MDTPENGETLVTRHIMNFSREKVQ